MKKLTAVVLAAGAAKRFWPLQTNKVLFPIFGKRLIDSSVIDALPSEVEEVVVVSNVDNKDALSQIQFNKPTTIVLQQHPLGMGDALLSAAGALANRSLLILIADDVLAPSPLSQVVKRAKKDSAFAVLPAYAPGSHFPGGYLRIDGERVLGIVEKPEMGNEPSPYVVTSGHYIEDSSILLDELRHIGGAGDDAYERALTMLAMRQQIVFEPFSGSFVSLKYPWHVLDLFSLMATTIKSRKPKSASIAKNVTIEGQVWLGNDVRIFENTKIIGPVYIGDRTIIGNNNLIRESYIGADCVTGFSTDITRSYIGDHCWFHNNYIGDSVLESGVTMGGGATLANLRLDDGVIASSVQRVKMSTGRSKLGSVIGANVRIGVNTSVMPGVKIGGNSMIGSGIVIDVDVPENSYVSLAKSQYLIRSNATSVPSPERETYKKNL